MKRLIIISVICFLTASFSYPCFKTNPYKVEWKIVSIQTSRISKKLDKDYKLYFKRTILGPDLYIRETSCKNPQSWFYCEIGFSFLRRPNKKIAMCLMNRDFLCNSSVFKDLFPDLASFFKQARGEISLRNDTLLINLKESTESPSDWVIISCVKAP